MGEPEDRADTLEGQMRLRWVKACHWEEVAPQSSFVAFPPENPDQAEYNKAVIAYQEHLESLKKPKKGA